MTKPRLTFEEHDEFGGRLAAVREELRILSLHLSNAYPRSGPESVPAKKIEEARRTLGEALDSLETCLYDEHPRQASTDVYSRGRR
ncbi:hypothetical protein OG693_39430 (plasmid) [Streptomyces sp. NBC_01259]|uniref:hypothetical protein n=1 Tax=Streptomyces sp. NBC_01259 TaxID=2903800 RepID=UPI002F909C0B